MSNLPQGSARPRRRLVFLSRPGCGLCDQALPSVQKAAQWLRCDVEVVDITGDADLEAEYHLRIPVVLDRAGRPTAEGQISFRQALLAALKAWQ